GGRGRHARRTPGPGRGSAREAGPPTPVRGTIPGHPDFSLGGIYFPSDGNRILSEPAGCREVSDREWGNTKKFKGLRSRPPAGPLGTRSALLPSGREWASSTSRPGWRDLTGDPSGPSRLSGGQGGSGDELATIRDIRPGCRIIRFCRRRGTRGGVR